MHHLDYMLATLRTQELRRAAERPEARAIRELRERRSEGGRPSRRR